MKTNAKHTPGPWEMNILEGLNNMLDHSKPKGLPILANGKIVCVIPSPADAGIDGFAQDANARLIAASPELLRELKKCVAAIQKWGKEHPESGGWMGVISGGLKAIAQAEGGAQ